MSANKPRIVKFTVEGTGTFPIDMLRYDSAWPASQTDAATIERTFRRGERGPYRVKLGALDYGAGPQRSRWRSFNWPVVDVEHPRPIS